jgi:hypothetical protein
LYVIRKEKEYFEFYLFVFSSGSSVPIEIGEMDGRNAGSAVIGFVNGMYVIRFHSLSLIPYTETLQKKRNEFWNDKTINRTHDNIGMK